MKHKAVISLLIIAIFFPLIFSCSTKCTQFNIAEYQLKVKPTINVIDRSGPDDKGVANFPIKIAVIKKYCDGKLGNEEFLEGVTNAYGTYQAPGSWTLNIDSRADEVLINVYEPSGDRIGTCTYSFSEFKSLNLFAPNCAVEFSN